MGRLRNLVFKALRYSGVPFLIREVLQRRRVTIVMFHDPAPDVAARAFGYLARRYNVIGLDRLLDACRRGDASQLPPKALVITLDDGHAGNYDLLPLLKKTRLPVTIFLCSGVIDTQRHYWFLHKHPALDKPALKRASNESRLRQLAAAGFWPEKEFDQAQALDKKQILEMAPSVNFQSHTHFHPCLPTCDADEAHFEIAHSRQVLERNFGLRVNALAFPNGDYSERDIELIKEAGYAGAITVDYGFNTVHTDPYRLKRLSIDDTDNVDAVAVKASGLWTLLMHWAGARRLSGLTSSPTPEAAFA